MPTAGHFYCDVCVMPFEDNAHLQRHLGTNKHVNTLIKKRGGNIDELDMDEVVNIDKLTKQELRDYVKNTNRYKELIEDVIAEKEKAFSRRHEITYILGDEDTSIEGDGDGSDDESITRRKVQRLTKCKLSCDERYDLLNEQVILDNQIIPKLLKRWGEIVVEARELVLKELRAEYLVFQKAKERRLEREKKEAERQADKDKKDAERQAEKDRKEAERQQEKDRKEADRKRREEMSRMILQAKIGMLNK
jgi:hypothetical protein